MARIAGPLQRAMANYPTSMVTSHSAPGHQADDISFAPQAVAPPS